MGARSSGESNTYIAKGGINKREIYIIADVLFYYALQPTLLYNEPILCREAFCCRSLLAVKQEDERRHCLHCAALNDGGIINFSVDEVINALNAKGNN